MIKFLSIIALACTLVLGAMYYQTVRPSSYSTEYLLEVHPGDTLRTIGRRLYQDKIISSPRIFYAYGRVMYRAKILRTGVFRISPYGNIQQIIKILEEGKTIQYKITIPEGLTVQQIVKLLESYPFLKADLETLPPEGSLYPSTYLVAPGTKHSALIKVMADKMTFLLNTLWDQRQSGLPLSSPHEALVLASIVERETSLPEERPLIAGTFINRLWKKMKLQADPTTIYGLSHGWGRLDRPLTREDMRHISLYNTYVIKGLPPTPIANSGRAALEAVLLYPAKTNALYFVANGQGGHHFSSHLCHHNTHVKKLKKLRRLG